MSTLHISIRATTLGSIGITYLFSAANRLLAEPDGLGHGVCRPDRLWRSYSQLAQSGQASRRYSNLTKPVRFI